MKKILQYGRHLLKAKGRHGTHSPFVYAFVEQVLRNKERFNIQDDSGLFSRKEIDLLTKIIKYLKPSRIIADAEMINLLKQATAVLKQAHITLAVLNETSDKLIEEGSTLIISFNREIPVKRLLAKAIQQHNIYVLQSRPQADLPAKENWYELCALHEVKMRLDLWHFGLLANAPSFKGSQYFHLR